MNVGEGREGEGVCECGGGGGGKERVYVNGGGGGKGGGEGEGAMFPTAKTKPVCFLVYTQSKGWSTDKTDLLHLHLG